METLPKDGIMLQTVVYWRHGQCCAAGALEANLMQFLVKYFFIFCSRTQIVYCVKQKKHVSF